MRTLLTAFCLLPSAAWADPPSLDVPAEVRPAGQYVRLLPRTDAVEVTYIGLSGLDAFPSAELRDPRRFVLDTRGLAPGRYRFAAVASGARGQQTRADFVVVIDGPGPSTSPSLIETGKPAVLPVAAAAPVRAESLGFDLATVMHRPAGAARGRAAALAANFEDAALRLEQGAAVAEVNAELRKRNTATLAVHLEAWRPWFEAWRKNMDHHNASGQVSRDHYRSAYRETAAGLREVK